MAIGLAVADIKTSLGITVTTYDALLTSWLSAAEERIQKYCNRDFGSATVTEYYTGTGTPFLPLRRSPVTSVTNAYVAAAGAYGSGPDGYGDALTQGVDYCLRKDNQVPANAAGLTGILEHLHGVWPDKEYRRRLGNLEVVPGWVGGNIKVVYVAGEAPVTVKLAAAFLMQFWLTVYERGGYPLQQEKLGAYSYQVASTAFNTRHGLPRGVADLLKPFRVRPVG